MTTPFLLQTEHLGRDYGRHRGVADVNLSVTTGEVVGLLGSNGAGKSTILQLLAGTLAASHGRVVVAGHDMARRPTRAKRHIGYLAERPALYPELTVDESLDLIARLHRLPRGERAKAIDRAKADTGLDDLGRRLIATLSKGMTQRAGIAQAIVHRPDLLLLDEPTAGLDPHQLAGMRALIERLSEHHGVIVSSHLLAEIQAVATRVVIVAGGQVVCDEAIDSAGHSRYDDWVELICRRPPKPDTLTGFAEIEQAERLDAQRLRVRGAPGSDIRDRLAELAVIHNWGLIGLARQDTGLEQRFMAATGQTLARETARP